MSEKKVVSRATAIALGALCVILLMGTVGAVVYYNNLVTQKNTAYDTLSLEHSTYLNSHSHTNSEFESLKAEYNNYVAAHSQPSSDYSQLVSQLESANSQITSLNSQISTLKAAKIKISTTVVDNRPLLGSPYLRITGWLANVGTNTANNVKLHVVAMQSSVVAIDTYIVVGSVNGETLMSLSTNDINYAGNAITGYTITPEWT